MKWYFSLSEASINRPEHGWRDLIRVAVLSARRNTSFHPHMLYDGEENEFTAELRAMGVTVIRRRVSFYDALATRGAGYLAIASGAFLRVEIPEIEREEEVILYTDCDVIFRSNPVFSEKPDFFAAAPQTSIGDYANDMNTGVMLMNLPALRAELPEFRRFIIRLLHHGLPGCDQENYRRFYAGRWSPLDARYNWKPYWGSNPNAVIVHWHGPKPMLIHKLLQNPELDTNPDWRQLYDGAKQGYADAFADWARIARDTSRRAPHLFVDEATDRKVRGWATDLEDPSTPLFLSFLVGGRSVWEGECAQPRPDVLRAGYPEHVGFEFELPADVARGAGQLTILDRFGRRLRMMAGGRAQHEVALERAVFEECDA
jgi:hypothetical protein